MRIVVVLLMLLLCNGAIAASAHWTGVILSDAGSYPNGVREYHLGGDIYGTNGEYAWMHSFVDVHMSDGEVSMKHTDFSLESIEPTYNWWALAVYGDVVGEATFDSLTRIEDYYATNPNDPYTGGTLVESPNDFYMAFKVSEVLVEGNGYVPGQTWYGWAHVSIDENLNMTLLGEGINLDGGAVTVGVVPEPSAALLLLAGGALLALRRRERQRRWGGS